MRDSKSPYFSSTFFSILFDLNKAVFWTILIHSPISKSFSLEKPLGAVPKALNTIGITVTVMFHSFFLASRKGPKICLPFPFLLFPLGGPPELQNIQDGKFWGGRVFANGPGDLGSVPGRVIPKTLKMILDTSLLNTQHYKVRIKGKVDQSWERSSALLYTSV